MLAFFILDEWVYTDYWYIFGFCWYGDDALDLCNNRLFVSFFSVVPFTFEIALIIAVFCLKTNV